ncbi:MAG: UDP-N-acetylmuramate--L-alanine ligase, partial [Clostridiales bacterium]|nr:UDP-N-acetylmuramate--L-alanine ligase [Clostridiales bacterium]
NRKCIYFDQIVTSNITAKEGEQFFDLTIDGNTYPVELGVVGEHNVYNAKAAIACALSLGVSIEQTVAALKHFHGVDRRWTEKHIDGLCKVVCDYAHHPTEIACAVRTAKSIANGKVVCVFQPHTYSRTRTFFKQFAACFTQADVVAYLPIYSAREKPLNGVTSQHLTLLAQNMGVNAIYMPDFETAVRWIRRTV